MASDDGGSIDGREGRTENLASVNKYKRDSRAVEDGVNDDKRGRAISACEAVVERRAARIFER